MSLTLQCRSFLRRRVFGVAVILVWLGMMGALVQKQHQGFSAGRLPAGASLSGEASEEWLGVYHQKEKIGYCHRSYRPEGEGYLLEERSYLEFAIQGYPLTVSMETRGVVAGDLGLESFRFELQSGLVATTVDGKVEGSRLSLELTTAGSKTRRTIELSGRATLPGAVAVLLRNQPLKAGQTFRLPVLDPATLSLKEMVVEVKGEDFVDLDGEAVPAYRLAASYAGVTVDFWVDSRGDTLKENTPLGWEVIRENRESALTRGWKSGVKVDVSWATSIAVEGAPILDPRRTRFLCAQLPPAITEGLDLTGDRQEIRSGTLPLLYVRREEIGWLQAPEIPLSRPEMRSCLVPDLFIQSDHPEVVSQAKQIAGGERNSLVVAKLLLDWVHDNLEKRAVPSLPNALEVLRRKVGDCNEHTVLYVALARALGLPARINAGLVLVDGRFYYHAWPDVFVGEWVSLDPVFDQLPADATHIRLVRGGLDRQVEIVRLMGKLKTLNIVAAQ